MIPEDILRSRIRLKFGHTVMALVKDGGVYKAYAYIEDPSVGPNEPDATYTLGGRSIDEYFAAHEARNILEKIMVTNMEKGSGHRVFAFAVGRELAFLAFAEGLIVNDRLTPEENGLYRGEIILFGRPLPLYVEDSFRILGSEVTAATVDCNLRIIE